MTMLSFRVAEGLASQLQAWTDSLGIGRSEFLREALRRELVRLRVESEVEVVERMPPTNAERSLGEISDWGPAEDWSDWDDAAR